MATKNKDHVNQRVRKIDGVEVTPCLYNGKGVGHGKYFAAMVSGQLVCDDTGRPLNFRNAGALEVEATK